MSIEAVKWALQDAPPCDSPRETLILVYLAERADKYGDNAFPSKKTIAEHLFGDYPPEPPQNASKEERAPYLRDKEAKERKVQQALARLRRSGHITEALDCRNPRWLAIPSDKKPTPYKLNMSMIRESAGTNSSSRRGDENISGGRIHPERGDENIQREGTNMYPKPSSKPPGEPGGGGGRRSTKLAAVVPAADTPPKNHLNIPEGWLEMNDGIQRCLERHPDGNHRNEPCRSCRDTETQIGRLRGERAREDAAREREQSSNRRRGKDSCDICDDRGERPGINSRTNQVDYPKCDHTENDRRDAIEALMKEGKVSAVQRMESGRTRLKAV